MGAYALLSHFTRYAFVFITAFVLFRGYYRRTELRAGTFWRRRFNLILLPYLIWSVIYSMLGYADNPWPGLGMAVGETAAKIITGNAWYHMYFLMVSMQFYLLFPVFRWVVRKTESHHGVLLAVAAMIQVGYMWMVCYVPAPSGLLGLLWRHSWVAFPMYLLFITLGALWAVHYQRVHAWVVDHQQVLWAFVVLGFATTLGVFLVRVKVFGLPPEVADAAMHPDVLPWALGCIIGLYLAGWTWSRQRGDGQGLLGRFVDAGTVRAFGVFACHPLLLWLLGRCGYITWLSVHVSRDAIRVPLLILTTISLSLVFVELLLYSPVSRLLVARRRQLLPRIIWSPAVALREMSAPNDSHHG